MSLSLLMAVLGVVHSVVSAPQNPPTLAERLGYKPTDRILIVNSDDVGMCHAANRAVIEGMERGMITSATIMVPCPWFTEIARYAAAQGSKRDFGIHLTHTSEWQVYRWGPVASKSEVPGLVGPDGYMWRSVQEVYQNATPEQAEIEARAQIKMALAAGVDITHIDSHMGTMQLDPRYHAIYIKLAKEFNVPLRMASQSTYERFGVPGLRAQAAALGLVFPDYLIYDEQPKPGETTKEYWMRIVKNLKPGVTELYIHAALPTEELQAITGSWKTRGEEAALFTSDEDMRRLIKEEGIILIGYRALRDLQRKSASDRPASAR